MVQLLHLGAVSHVTVTVFADTYLSPNINPSLLSWPGPHCSLSSSFPFFPRILCFGAMLSNILIQVSRARNTFSGKEDKPTGHSVNKHWMLVYSTKLHFSKVFDGDIQDNLNANYFIAAFSSWSFVEFIFLNRAFETVLFLWLQQACIHSCYALP